MSQDPASKQTNEGSGSGYSYGGGGYAGYSAAGYGYGDGEAGGSAVQRTLHDYLLILRERIWYIVVVFLVVFSSSLVYTLSEPKIYQATATVQLFRRDPTVMQVQQVMDTEMRSADDINTQIKLIESQAIAQRVAERITGPDLAQFLAPYDRPATDTGAVLGLLFSNRRIALQRLTLVVAISYNHPDRFVAAKVANLFAEAYIQYNKTQRVLQTTDAIEGLISTADDQQKKVQDMRRKVQAYTESKNMPALDQRRDIVTDALKAANAELNRAQLAFSAIENRRNQVLEIQARKGDLTDLSFIANQPAVAQLTQQITAQTVAVQTLARRYKDGHPDMKRAKFTLEQMQKELTGQLESACAQIESDYKAAQLTFEQAKAELQRRTEETQQVDQFAVEYNDLQSQLRVQEQILTTISTRRTETSMSNQIITVNARIIDPASPPPESRPVSPNVPLNLGLGIVGGLGLGLAFAFFVAFIDDRVKSSFDIEQVVGLPLIGIIPQIKRMDQAEKAQIVLNNADRQVAEAFLTLHSSLRLKDESKNAKCILITSTIPGEGKSFSTTNLALTFASHGEKVVVIDCDLRKPNIHKLLQIENTKGVIDVCGGKATLDEVTQRNVQTNLDVIPAGGRAKNPTQVLNSKGFELMLTDLRKRYDRVFIDTPPLAAVSDALIILPLVDGSIFTIFFNKVRRKAAQFSAKRLLEANVPNFGAVLNGLNLAVSGYYYAQYYDKSYKDYYVVMAKEDGPPER
jgi:succinoglycan biosynthesis transport protein ExoP